MMISNKVHVFWEGHRIWKNITPKIWCYSVTLKLKIFFKFCGPSKLICVCQVAGISKRSNDKQKSFVPKKKLHASIWDFKKQKIWFSDFLIFWTVTCISACNYKAVNFSSLAAKCNFASIFEYSAFYEFSVLPFYNYTVFYDIKHESSLENLHCVINRSESNKTLYIWWNEGAHR